MYSVFVSVFFPVLSLNVNLLDFDFSVYFRCFELFLQCGYRVMGDHVSAFFVC